MFRKIEIPCFIPTAWFFILRALLARVRSCFVKLFKLMCFVLNRRLNYWKHAKSESTHGKVLCLEISHLVRTSILLWSETITFSLTKIHFLPFPLGHEGSCANAWTNVTKVSHVKVSFSERSNQTDCLKLVNFVVRVDSTSIERGFQTIHYWILISCC